LRALFSTDMEKEDLSEKRLREMYHDREMSLSEIADETGVFSYHLWERMEALGIERRSPGEGQQLKREQQQPGEEERGKDADADRPDEEEEQERVSDRIYFSPLHYYVEEVMDKEAQ